MHLDGHPAGRQRTRLLGDHPGQCALALGAISFGVGVPELPESATAEAARAYLTDNSAALRLFGISMAASAVLLVVVVARLRALMAAAEERRGYLRDVAFGAGLPPSSTASTACRTRSCWATTG
jgi:hypothetical protein